MAALIRILAIMEKDFRTIYRNKVLLTFLILYPQFYIFIDSHLINFNLCEFNVAMVDNDRSELSSRIASDIGNSSQMSLGNTFSTFIEARKALDRGDIDCIVEIPHGYERHLLTGNMMGDKRISITANAVNTSSAILGTQQIVGTVSHGIKQYATENGMTQISRRQENTISTCTLYNPTLDFLLFMLPVLLLSITLMICNQTTIPIITNDLESGAFYMLNVSPATPNLIMLSRVLTSYVIGFMEMFYMLLTFKIIYGFTLSGSFIATWLIFSLFLLWSVSLAQLISNFFENAMLTVIFYNVFTRVSQLASGYETPIESMKEWVQDITYISPTRYLVEGLRGTFLKGAGFSDLWWQILLLAGIALLTYLLAVVTYKTKRK